MEPWGREIRGRFDKVTFESHALKNHPLHDPAERPLWVYLPPGS